MVDSINNSSANSLLRAQQAAQTQSLNNNRQIAQTVINQTRNAAIVPVKAAGVPQTTKLAVSSDSVLPRGSLVDKLV